MSFVLLNPPLVGVVPEAQCFTVVSLFLFCRVYLAAVRVSVAQPAPQGWELETVEVVSTGAGTDGITVADSVMGEPMT